MQNSILRRWTALLVLNALVFTTCFAKAESEVDTLARALSIAKNGDPAGAYGLIVPLAKSGNPIAQLYLGKMKAAGQGTGKDPVSAAEWWRLAADQGNREAQLLLGIAYAAGIGVQRDGIEGLKWLIIARAKDGLAYSMLADELGRVKVAIAEEDAYVWICRRSNAIARESDKSENLTELTELAAEGNACAQYELGRVYQAGLIHIPTVESKSKASWLLPDRRPDPDKAEEFFRQAAEQGYTRAQVALADMLPRGGTEAAGWYQRAAKNGDAYAQSRLADLYASGLGVGRDHKKAVELYRQSALQENEYAMHALGEAYAQGTIARLDLERGYMWLVLAKVYADANFNVVVSEQAAKRVVAISEMLSTRRIDMAKEAAERCRQTKFRDCDQSRSGLFGEAWSLVLDALEIGAR